MSTSISSTDPHLAPVLNLAKLTIQGFVISLVIHAQAVTESITTSCPIAKLYEINPSQSNPIDLACGAVDIAPMERRGLSDHRYCKPLSTFV